MIRFLVLVALSGAVALWSGCSSDSPGAPGSSASSSTGGGATGSGGGTTGSSSAGGTSTGSSGSSGATTGTGAATTLSGVGSFEVDSGFFSMEHLQDGGFDRSVGVLFLFNAQVSCADIVAGQKVYGPGALLEVAELDAGAGPLGAATYSWPSDPLTPVSVGVTDELPDGGFRAIYAAGAASSGDASVTFSAPPGPGADVRGSFTSHSGDGGALSGTFDVPYCQALP